MLLVKTILITLIFLLARFHTFFGTSLINRPIIVGTLTGLALGDLQKGIIIGGTLELAFIGAVSIGAYIPPDMVSGTILGTAFAITSGSSPEVALALGLPISTIMLAVNTITGSPIQLLIVHKADDCAEKGDYKGVEKYTMLSGLIPKLITLPIVPLAFYFGSKPVEQLLGNIPQWLSKGINISGGLIPALGFAMLAQMIMNKKVVPFFFLGFFIVKYLKINTTGAAIFAAIIALILVQIEASNNKKAAVEVDDNEF